MSATSNRPCCSTSSSSRRSRCSSSSSCRRSPPRAPCLTIRRAAPGPPVRCRCRAGSRVRVVLQVRVLARVGQGLRVPTSAHRVGTIRPHPRRRSSARSGLLLCTRAPSGKGLFFLLCCCNVVIARINRKIGRLTSKQRNYYKMRLCFEPKKKK